MEIHCTEGWEGPLETSKPSKKLSTTAKPQKNAIKIENLMQNRQNLYVFTSQFSKPWSIRYSVDKWNIQRFRGYSRSVAAWIEEKPESKWQNPKTTLETKSETHKTSIYDETEKHMLKNGKSVIRNEHTIWKTKIPRHKNRS